MMQDDKAILKAFANAKVKESKLKAEIKELQPEVERIVNELTNGEKGDTVLVKGGKISITEGTRKYVYPEHVIEQEELLKEQIKDIKTLSEQVGDGTYEIPRGIRFTIDKK